MVLDTRTQLLWLTTAHTVNYSYLSAVAATGPGGVFEGFRHATVQEVDGLLESAGLPVGGQIFESDPRLAPLPAFIGMFGRTEIFNGRDHLVGITGSAVTPPPSGVWREAGVHFLFSLPESYYRMGDIGSAISGEIGSPALANWMVMQVPEPATWLLIAAGGLAAFFARSRPTPTVDRPHVAGSQSCGENDPTTSARG